MFNSLESQFEKKITSVQINDDWEDITRLKKFLMIKIIFSKKGNYSYQSYP